ncbi:DUF5083 domain-containing protein [Staphylococcus gallinarum]|uniref:DUF5083 domain-containing protein n=1 Tax=Staphylococcus gallinarum TaxID=1293 RepID=A0A418HMP6_STAGA|nr:DUF5083 family protein [Staphylococcus gallinarum]MCD8821041.1 DUF5083 family protein [Staphylococcus gallinarum]RIL42076.1 DUF5083 domain-containing protein [Staphylococcus gallinarum]RIO96423.1 DUF5083 domain-containing protein [Staphylococcus gallinarum]
MKELKSTNKKLLAFEILPFIVFLFGLPLPFIVPLFFSYNDNLIDTLALTVLFTFICVYIITIIIEIITYFLFTRKVTCDVSDIEMCNRVKATKVLSILYMIPLLYFIAFYFRLLHVRSFRENKVSGQPAYHFWEFFLKADKKPFELQDLFKK